MIFNLSNRYEQDKFKEYVNKLYSDRAVVEVKKKFPNRTLKQNSYLHVILSYFGAEFGYDLRYVKDEIFKRMVNAELFVVKRETKYGKEYETLRSSSDLSTSEMTAAIERFRNWSAAEGGLYIPSPDEKEAIVYAQQQVEKVMLYN